MSIEQPSDQLADAIADEFGIKGLAVDNGVPTLTTVPTSERARELVLAMSLACGRMLDDDQAPNYVEFEVSPAGHPGYVVHVRRAGGPTPHTLRKEADARAADLATKVARITAMVDHGLHSEDPDEHDCAVEPCWAVVLRRALDIEKSDV